MSEEAPSSETASVRLDGLTKAFGDEGDVRAVDDVSLSVRPGEFLVLVGPSGCGKSTLLRTLAGLETPTEGRVLLNGEDVTGREPRERDVAMVFQNYALYPHKTVRGNLAFPLQVRNYPSDSIDERVEETAELLGIDPLLDRRPGQLSGGQQQRVALGRAIVREPALFLMDEPLSNLDARLRVQMRDELAAIHERVGETTVYVTHDQAEAMTLGDRIAVVRNGRIQQVGPPQRVYEEPVNEFVAGFVGEPPTNVLDATLEPATEPERVDAGWLTVPLSPERADRLRGRDVDPDAVRLGIRPEDVDDAALRSAVEPEATVEVRVARLKPLGSELHATLTPPEATGPDPDASITAAFDPDSDVIEGERVTVAVDPDRCHVFDARTGETLTIAHDGAAGENPDPRGDDPDGDHAP